MRVKIGEVVDITQPFSLDGLSPRLKLSVIWETLVSDSMFLGRSRKREQEKEEAKKLGRYVSLKSGLTMCIRANLVENLILKDLGKTAKEVYIPIEVDYSDVSEKVKASPELKMFNIDSLELDPDVKESFRFLPEIIKITRREFSE